MENPIEKISQEDENPEHMKKEIFGERLRGMNPTSVFIDEAIDVPGINKSENA